MKLISETPTKLFYAVVVPMDTKKIYIKGNIYDDTFVLNYDGYNIGLGELKSPEILGIQGGGESLTEEQAREVMDDKSNIVQDHLFAYKELLKGRLNELGLETENPYSSIPKLKDKFSSEEWETQFLKYSDAEKSLVKVVIIKSEK